LKLEQLLSLPDDEAFFTLIWALDALRTGREKSASRYLRFPPEAATDNRAAQFAIHEWELETLVGQFFVTPKAIFSPRNLDCPRFGAATELVNALRELENDEAGLLLGRLNIFDEMHRIGHRQFAWQRGYFNRPQVYRYGYVYGQGECAEYFRDTYGLTINEFSLIGFAMYAALDREPSVNRLASLTPFGINPVKREAALRLLSLPIEQARVDAVSKWNDANTKHGARLPTSYQPSFLRLYPMISFRLGRRLHAPLRDLILLRITAGLYYDLVRATAARRSELLNEASSRFEDYSARFIAAMLPRFEIRRSYKYLLRGQHIDSPDILLRSAGTVLAAVECKATKLTFAAQFADDPVAQAEREHGEIAKGVFQLWRYFSHARRGLIPADEIRPDAHGIVLTLDPWLFMSPKRLQDVLAIAEGLANRESEIIREDRRKVVFCDIAELERLLTLADEDAFLRTLSAAKESKFGVWQLFNIYQEIGEKRGHKKEYPFDLGDVVPWWRDLEKLSVASPQ
jgi:hypothetical protein